ncbi:EAL domain-containing protein [Ornithinibacillus scapharcae]|uniref:EAL domain-containing protein n=1 Tax=Ornithinibacillus scapharcae TaxID=1147159 RepID=UPI000225B061|nr:EAL domain-containing protein [Ornithinibacillus scapharcae]
MINQYRNNIMDDLDIYHVIQPIIDLDRNNVFGYEMLLRSREFNNPELLLKKAEESNQLYELDMHSIRKAFETINNKANTLNGLYIFINILPSTIGNPASFKKIEQLKSSLKLTTGSVVLELTEERKEAELEMCVRMVDEIKNKGFLIALDDIGKGESTLPYVIELEPNIVKLDQYFSRDLANSPKKQKAIELLFHLIDEETIMILEGIENEADLQAAKKLGVRYAQGYHLGKPQVLNYYLANSEQVV